MKQDFDQYRYLNILISSVHKTLRKTLRFYPYKIKLIHAMKAEDGPARKRFADTMLQNICQDDRYLQKICLKTRQPFKSLELSTGIMSESGEPVIQESLLRKNETHPKSMSDAGCSTTESFDPFFFVSPLLHRIRTSKCLNPSYTHSCKVSKMLFSAGWCSPSFGLLEFGNP